MLDGKDSLIKIVRKRIFSGIIDFFIFSLFFVLLLRLIGLSIGVLDADTEFEVVGFIIMTTLPILSFILYFGIFPKLFNGQTVGDFIMGIRIVKIDDSPLKTLELSRKTLRGIFSYIKFLSFRRVFFNSLGQFYYDEDVGTIVVDKEQGEISGLKNLDIDTKYEYDFLLDSANLKILFYTILIVALVSIFENFIS